MTLPVFQPIRCLLSWFYTDGTNSQPLKRIATDNMHKEKRSENSPLVQ